jgi:tRNA nucleotidyltransferase (CCA-adding enzyme)
VELSCDERLLERLADLPAARLLIAGPGDGEGVYVVGGAVRDLLLGTEPLDLDVVVEGEPERVVSALGAPAHVHDRFGTATVEIGGVRYDIARARRESYARPGALPTVTPATIEEDLARRDFTVNALALGLGGRRRGRLVTFPGALEDLRGRTLRILHDASFRDDPTRLLRLARYASRLGFSVEDGTRRLALQALEGGALQTVTGSRLGAELRLLAQEPDPVQALSALHDLGVDEALEPGFGLRDPEVAARALALLGADGDRGALALAAASLSLAPQALAALLDRLAFPAGQRDLILAAASGSRNLARALARAVLPSEIAAAAAGSSVESVALAGALGPAAVARRWLSQLRHVELEIDGGDLVAAGVLPGPQIGAGLRAALAAKLDGELDGRAQELTRALEAAADSG